MSRVHELKIQSQYFVRVKDGSKTFEIRRNDRDFQLGDAVILKEWSFMGGYTKREIKAEIGYITALFQQEEYVVFSLLNCVAIGCCEDDK